MAFAQIFPWLSTIILCSVSCTLLTNLLKEQQIRLCNKFFICNFQAHPHLSTPSLEDLFQAKKTIKVTQSVHHGSHALLNMVPYWKDIYTCTYIYFRGYKPLVSLQNRVVGVRLMSHHKLFLCTCIIHDSQSYHKLYRNSSKGFSNLQVVLFYPNSKILKLWNDWNSKTLQH